jgi:hypothetical protein
VEDNDFLLFRGHFIKHVMITKFESVLLLLDNHQSHISLGVLNLGKESLMVSFSFPPHSTHKLKPLYRSIYGPLKTSVNSASDSWLRSQSERVTIYHIASIMKQFLPNVLTPKGINSGFSVKGIWPLNTCLFTDEDFSPSLMTDRPL